MKTDFKMNIPAPVLFVIKKLTDAGFSAHCVGGCVRDFLMGNTPSDYDVTTSARPEEMQAVFSDCKVVETGLKHGTITVVLDRMNIEITTYRIDGAYGDCRHPESVIFTDRLSDDLCRRDFTVNAMAYSEEKGLTDLFGGIEDIHNKTIRCVGNAEDRFTEDGLRILRALRFSSVLGFTPDSECTSAIKKLTHLLSNISRERIYAEMTKLLGGKNCAVILSSFADTIAYAVGVTEDDVLFAADCIKNDSKSTPLMRYAVLLSRNDPEKARFIFNNLKPSNDEKNTVLSYLKYKDYSFSDLYSVRHLMCQTCFDFPEELAVFRSLLRISDEEEEKTVSAYVNTVKENDLCCSLAQLDINGSDLIGYGLKGHEIGDSLKFLLDKVLRDEIPNNKEDLKNQLGNGLK